MKTIMEAKNIIEGVKALQLLGKRFPCPRCGHDRMDEKAVRNALSRYADVYVCDKCGTDEAVRIFEKLEPLPLNKWKMVLADDVKLSNKVRKGGGVDGY